MSQHERQRDNNQAGPELWTAVDRYIEETLIPSDPALEAALKASEDAGLPSNQVAPNQGKFLALLASIRGARRILQLGTLGGYSTIWLARALPVGGQLITLEADPKHAEVARANIARAGLSDRVEVRLGLAIESLPRIAGEGQSPFDFVFIDADKANIPEYLDWALKLTRPGSVIVVDNVVRRGGLIDPSSTDVNVRGVRRFHEKLATLHQLSATTVQTVGSKGYDGFTLIVVGG
jgi:predicted O-methyltransferase YrrM